MYVDIFKIFRVFLYLMGMFFIAVGLFLFALSKVPQEQLVGITAAQFGLLFTWFVAWIGRGSKVKKHDRS